MILTVYRFSFSKKSLIEIFTNRDKVPMQLNLSWYLQFHYSIQKVRNVGLLSCLNLVNCF